MNNCQASGVAPDETPDSELDPRKWPNTRRALVVARLDYYLAKLPRREWFDRALAAHLAEGGKR